MLVSAGTRSVPPHEFFQTSVVYTSSYCLFSDDGVRRAFDLRAVATTHQAAVARLLEGIFCLLSDGMICLFVGSGTGRKESANSDTHPNNQPDSNSS